MALPHHYFPEVDSTMIRARALVSDAPPDTAGFWVRTDHQRQGRGRRARRWDDRAGDALLATLAIRRGGALDPGDSHAGTLALRTAAAVYRIVTSCVAPELVRIKWPNDILVDERKVCGILLEGDARWFLVGIGLNVRGAPSAATSLEAYRDPGRVGFPAASGGPVECTPEGLFPALMDAVERGLRDSRWHATVSRALAWRDRFVTIEQNGVTRQAGVLQDIAEDGALLLRVDAATLPVRVYAGTVRLNRNRESINPG
jgi:BirA family transcriptional regulator, biotin operon repressor / biotin---[acetyl-CoA-carboxylase] ligase